jgi:hypothetical protein
MTTGDFARMQEGGRLMSQANSMQTGRFANVDVKRSASVVAGLEGLGGTFKGDAGMSKFQSIDESIRNPKNDFVKATLFRALMAENPNMSMIDLEKRMEAGAMGDGNLNAFIKQIGSQSGVDTERATSDEMLQNDMFVRNLKFGTGLNYADTEGLIRGGRSKGTGAFDIFDMKQGEDKSFGLIGRSQSVNPITSEVKGIDDFLANNEFVKEKALNVVRGTRQFLEDPEAFKNKLLASMGESIKKGLSEFGSSVGGYLLNGLKSLLGIGDSGTPTKDKDPKALEKNTEATGKLTDAIINLSKEPQKENKLNSGIKSK